MKRLLTLGGLLLLAACETTMTNTVIGTPPLQLQGGGPATAAAAATTCPASISVVDESTKSAPLNELGNRVVESAARAALTGLGPEILEVPASGDLRIVVRRAYVHNLASSKSAVVVITATPGESGETTIYRGRSVGVNWWGTLREYENGITAAVEQALAPLRAELDAACAA